MAKPNPIPADGRLLKSLKRPLKGFGLLKAFY